MIGKTLEDYRNHNTIEYAAYLGLPEDAYAIYSDEISDPLNLLALVTTTQGEDDYEDEVGITLSVVGEESVNSLWLSKEDLDEFIEELIHRRDAIKADPRSS